MRLTAPLTGYPGWGAPVKGKFFYADLPMPGTRSLEVYVDGSLALSTSVGEEFEIQVPLGAVQLGGHRLMVIAPGKERYGPVTTEAPLAVVRAIPIVKLHTPPMALIPLGVAVRGQAQSQVGPLANARINLKFGRGEAQVTSLADGTFQHKLRSGFPLMPIGLQSLEVQVIPSEPWHSALSTKRNIVAFNPASLAFIAVAALAMRYRGRLRKRSGKPVAQPVAQPVPRVAPAEAPGATLFDLFRWQPVAAPLDKEGREGDRVLFLYRSLVVPLLRRSGLGIKSHLTLRELAIGLRPQLNGASTYLWQMTLIVEKAVYSGRSLTEPERQEMEGLARQFQESRPHEP